MLKPTTIEDYAAWEVVHNEDAWVFDKMIVAKLLGYKCGPSGTDVPKPGRYVVRPCVNVYGMGEEASIKRIHKYTYDKVPPGYFWCEIFKGRHLSVDYYKGRQILCVEGFRDDMNNLQRWSMWKKVDDKVPYPKILKRLRGKYPYINVEFIGDKLIEIHLRPSHDFEGHSSPYVRPVWKGEKVRPKAGEEFFKCEDGDRIGFYIQKETK